MVLNDFMRGKIPWFTPPPVSEGQEAQTQVEGSRTGDLAKINKVPTQDLRARKRKRDDEQDAEEDGQKGQVVEAEVLADAAESSDVEAEENDDDEVSVDFSSDEESEQADPEGGVEVLPTSDDVTLNVYDHDEDASDEDDRP